MQRESTGKGREVDMKSVVDAGKDPRRKNAGEVGQQHGVGVLSVRLAITG